MGGRKRGQHDRNVLCVGVFLLLKMVVSHVSSLLSVPRSVRFVLYTYPTTRDRVFLSRKAGSVT